MSDAEVDAATGTLIELVPEGCYDGKIEVIESGISMKGTLFLRGGIRLARGELLFTYFAAQPVSLFTFLMAVKSRLIGMPVRVRVQHVQFLGKDRVTARMEESDA